MGDKVLAVLCLMALLCPTFALAARGSIASARLPLDMGYGPDELFPVSSGTPVYSAGDQLWVRSDLGSTVQIQVSRLGPNTTLLYASAAPGVPVRILTFDFAYSQGLWFIQEIGYRPLVFLVSNAGAASANLTLAGRMLTGGSLAMNFTSSSPYTVYDAQACVLGASNSSIAAVPVPRQEGAGTITLARHDNVLEVGGAGLGRANYSLSVELYYSYSFLAPNATSTLLSRSVRVATTDAVLVTGRTSIHFLTLQSDVPLKVGRYQLRAFFQGPSGLALSTTDVLVTDQHSWVWLGDCESTPVFSNNFELLAPLGTDPSAWPRAVWLTYTSYGEEGFAEVRLGINVASVSLIGEPWGVKLSSYSIKANPSYGISQTDVHNGTIFMLLDAPTAFANYVNYGAGLGDRALFSGRVGPIAPFTSTQLLVNVSRLSVTYLISGSPYEGGTVRLYDKGGELTAGATDGRGRAIFYVPAGNYSVTASGGNSSASQAVSLGRGQSLELTLGGGSLVGWKPILVVSLAAAAGAGVVANVVLFVRGRGRVRRGADD